MPNQVFLLAIRQKGYEVYDFESKRIYVTRNVQFFEEKIPFAESFASKVIQHTDLDQKHTLESPFCHIKPIENASKLSGPSGPITHDKVPTIVESENPGVSHGSEVVT